MATAKKHEVCEAEFGSFGFGGFSGLKKCTKRATVVETGTVASGRTYRHIYCEHHRTRTESVIRMKINVQPA